MTKSDMLSILGAASNIPPQARALAFLALSQASESDIAKIGAAVESLKLGTPLEKVVAGLGLTPTAQASAIAFLKANHRIAEFLSKQIPA